MLTLPFTVPCLVQSSSSVTDTSWTVKLSIIPGSGFAYQVSAGDVLFLSMEASPNAPGTVGRYVVTAATPDTDTPDTIVTVSVDWGGVAEPVDPGEGSSERGYLSRPSGKNKLVWHPIPESLGVSKFLVEGARNTESFAIVDNLSPSNVKQVRSMLADTGVNLLTGDVVALTPTGALVKADPSNPDKMPAAGVVLRATANANEYEVQFGGALELAGATFTPGRFVWVGPAGLTTDMAAVPSNGVLQQVGMAMSATAVSLTIPGLVVTK